MNISMRRESIHSFKYQCHCPLRRKKRRKVVHASDFCRGWFKPGRQTLAGRTPIACNLSYVFLSLCWPKRCYASPNPPETSKKKMQINVHNLLWSFLPTAGPLQAHLARSNICEHLSSQEEMPRQTCFEKHWFTNSET